MFTNASNCHKNFSLSAALFPVCRTAIPAQQGKQQGRRQAAHGQRQQTAQTEQESAAENAQTQAKELSRNATVYCEGILKNSEEVLARSVADIKNTRMNLRNAARPNRGQK